MQDSTTIDYRSIAAKMLSRGLTPTPMMGDGTKRPMAQWRDYQDEPMASSELPGLFERTGGIGIICGKTSGFLEVLDVERRAIDEGAWDELCARAPSVLGDVWYELLEGYVVRTRSGGLHIGFRTEGPAQANQKLARRPSTPEELAENPKAKVQVLIETRGQGGLVMAPPTPGWSAEGKLRVPTITIAARDALYDLARMFDTVAESEPTASLPLPSTPSDGQGPMDWVRDNVDPVRLMEEGGWTLVSESKGQQQWTRPGKAAKDGTSATLHLPDGPLNIYSTAVDLEYERAGRRTKAEITLSVGELYAAIHHLGDVRAAAKHVRQNLMPDAEPPRSGGAGGAVRAQESHVEAGSTGLNLPDEFWERKSWLAHIAQAADSRLVSPDALLMSVVSRVAAMIPPEFQIPGIIGSAATFDWIGCVVSTSSGGKTISNGVARDLVPNRSVDILMDASPGSGEGLIQAFMGYEKDESGKRTGDPSWKFGDYKAIHLTVDEGTGLMEQQARKGTTIVQTLCSAWSGAGLGQLNASIETKRMVPPRKRRVSANVNIQTGFGYKLLGDELRQIGLPQRMVFAWAHAEPPEEVPAWPGELTIERPWTSGISFIDVCDEVAEIIVAHRRQQMAGKVVMDELDGHGHLAQLKLSGIFAILDRRREITLDDWDLASQVMDTHRTIRGHLLAVRSEQIRQQVVTNATAQAEREITIETVKDRQAIDRVSGRLIARIEAGGEATQAVLRRHLASRDRGHFEEALALAVSRGRLAVDEVEGQGTTGHVVRLA